MIGIVIVAHGALAQEYLSAVEHVVGRQSGVRAISIEPGANNELGSNSDFLLEEQATKNNNAKRPRNFKATPQLCPMPLGTRWLQTKLISQI